MENDGLWIGTRVCKDFDALVKNLCCTYVAAISTTRNEFLVLLLGERQIPVKA